MLRRARAYLREAKDLALDLRYGRLPEVLDNPFDLKLMNRFLRRAGLTQLHPRTEPASAGVTGAARYILANYLSDRRLQRDYPLGLREGSGGALCGALCARVGDTLPAAARIRAAFDCRPAERVRHTYEHYHFYWNELYPLALTPAGGRRFLQFLLQTARKPLKLSAEEILWFFLENAGDPFRGVTATYLRSPKWQAACPAGLTEGGFPALQKWIAAEYRLTDTAWLDRLPTPAIDYRARLGNSRVSGSGGANVLAHFRYPSGLQEAALNTVQALAAARLPHVCRDVPIDISVDQPGREDLLGLEMYDVSLLHLAPIPDPALHYPKAGLRQRPGVRRAGIWYWELEVVPEEWAAHAANLSEIWAPTRFIHGAMSRVMPVPVVPMLPGVPVPVPADLPRAHFGLDPDKFLFLFLFDMNSVMERKNPLGLIEAYRRAFGSSRGTHLAIKVSRGSLDPANMGALERAAELAGVTVIDRVMSRAESYALLNCCDAYVSLHRSEGFGLTIAEAMMLGKPVVATAYSGNLDFTTAENSRLIPGEMVPIAQAGKVYPRGGTWADPSVAAAAEAMRWIVEDRPGSRAMAERGRRGAGETLSLSAYGQRIRERLDNVGTAFDRDVSRRAA